MTWLSLIFWLVTHLSDIIGMVQKFLALIHTMPKGQREGLLARLHEARQANDVKAARSIIESTCSGTIGCAPQSMNEKAKAAE